MIWITLFLPLLASLTVNGNTVATLTEELEDVSPQEQKLYYHKEPSKDKCTMPCEMTAKLMRDEKHSLCTNLQHTMVSYTRNTRKLIRDLIEEQQKALEFLSSQIIDLMAKVNTLSSDVQRSNSDIFSVKPMESHGKDCSDIKETLGAVSPKIPSGIYIIQPENTDVSFEVFCEMDDMEGGWTVIQRRTDGLTDFKRMWSQYLDGFGHLPGEHWLGLRKIFSIVNQRNTRFQLHVSLISQDESTAYASYDSFWIEDETKFFAIHLGRYAGSAGDAFRGYDQEQNQDTAPFSTTDVDNDGCSPFCTFGDKAVESCSVNQNNTGWWFNQCGKANLNGSPMEQDFSTHSDIHWDTWTKNGTLVQIKSVTMKIRRVEIPNLK
nr:angiopoietin-related protein 5 isoform X3 [Danio rerio]|eukprot:XP_021329104.1 angiopoietin-related protein 5 isoform X3 [Danio rerio]